MKEQELDQTITATLWRFMLSYRYGSIKHIEKTMGVPMDALRTAKNGRFGLRVRHVTGAIKAMGIPPAVFFNEALGGGVNTTAEERFMARGAELAGGKLVDLPQLAEETKLDRLTEDDLERLDAARFEDPRAAAEQAAGLARLAARDGRRGDAAAAVARQGSALRVAEQWEPAWACVWWAMANAPDGPTGTDARARSAFIVSDYGEFADAAGIASRVAFEQMQLGRATSVGRALVDQGTFLRRDASHVNAIQSLKAALVFLPPTEHMNHFSAHQNLGLAYAALGDFDAATHHAGVADAEEAIPTNLLRYICWLRARIASGQENFSQAIALYRDTLRAFNDSPPNAALAGVELCRILFETGNPTEAAQQALDLACYAIPKQQNQIVAAAIMDLYRCAQDGALSMGFLEAVIRRMNEGLARRAAIRSRPAQR